MDLPEIFSEVPDFRLNRKKRHELGDILVLVICAVLSGADDFESIELYGKSKLSLLQSFLNLPNGIPSHDTINRVFRYMDKSKFGDCLVKWSKEILSSLESYQINIDGKVLRGTDKKGAKKSGICIVSAWATEQNLVLGQSKVDKKSNEKTAIPELLESLDLKNALVSIDAMGCNVKIANQIVAGGGDYLLALKKNNKDLHEEVADWLKRDRTDFDRYEKTDATGGRIERRRTTVCTDLDFLLEPKKFNNSRSIIQVESIRESNEEVTTDIRYYISSKVLSAKQFHEAVKNHWQIENNLHWMLDVVFKEDNNLTKKDNAPENLATVRKICLQLCYQNKDMSIPKMRKRAAWDDEYLLGLIQKF